MLEKFLKISGRVRIFFCLNGKKISKKYEDLGNLIILKSAV